MNSLITRLAQEVIDQAAEVGLAAEQMQPGTVAVSTAAYLQEAKDSLQRALETLRMKLDIESRHEP